MAAGLHHAAGRSAGHQGYQANKGPGWGGCRRPPGGPPTRVFGSASFTLVSRESRSEASHHDTQHSTVPDGMPPLECPVAGPPQAPVIHFESSWVPQQVANSGPPSEAESASSTNSSPRPGGRFRGMDWLLGNENWLLLAEWRGEVLSRVSLSGGFMMRMFCVTLPASESTYSSGYMRTKLVQGTCSPGLLVIFSNSLIFSSFFSGYIYNSLLFYVSCVRRFSKFIISVESFCFDSFPSS